MFEASLGRFSSPWPHSGTAAGNEDGERGPDKRDNRRYRVVMRHARFIARLALSACTRIADYKFF